MQIWIENMAQGTFKDMRSSFLVVFTENLGAVLKHLPLELVIQCSGKPQGYLTSMLD